jgi:hypothetical protein
MARRKAMKKMTPSVTTLRYKMDYSDTGVTRYVDLAKDLSKVNRRLMRQGYQYAVGGVTIISEDTAGSSSTTAIDFQLKTAGNTWVTQNAWKKGYSLWREMNKEVLDDNPSVQGKWADYKVYLNEQMAAANTLDNLDGAGVTYPANEWAVSTYVVPQHDVSLLDGTVLPAEEWVAALAGPDDVASKRFSLIKAYEESRATVQDVAPNVPANLSTSFYLRLTDDGSQDPELAAVIEDANDQPPYSQVDGDYPGGPNYGISGALTMQHRLIINQFQPNARLGGFVANCGLLQLNAKDITGSGRNGSIEILIHLVPGNYHGVLADRMGQ